MSRIHGDGSQLNVPAIIKPVKDSAPRLEVGTGTNKTKRWFFNSLSDLLDCLDKGTFQPNIEYDVTIKDGKTSLKVYTYGNHNGLGDGEVFFTPQRGNYTVVESSSKNGKKLVDYPLSEDPDESDSQDVYNRVVA